MREREYSDREDGKSKSQDQGRFEGGGGDRRLTRGCGPVGVKPHAVGEETEAWGAEDGFGILQAVGA